MCLSGANTSTYAVGGGDCTNAYVCGLGEGEYMLVRAQEKTLQDLFYRTNYKQSNVQRHFSDFKQVFSVEGMVLKTVFSRINESFYFCMLEIFLRSPSYFTMHLMQ